MKTQPPPKLLLICSFIALGFAGLVSSSAAPNDAIHTGIKPGPAGQVQISLHSQLNVPVSAQAAEYTVLRSTDLVTWAPVGEPFRGETGVSEEFLRRLIPAPDAHAFYRVSATLKFVGESEKLGAAIFGYGTEFNRQLFEIGQIPLDQFAQVYAPTGLYLPQLTFDPTTAEYWTNYSAGGRFALNPDELSRFETNGFVISQRLGSYSFANSFYRIFWSDLPVYVSCDAVLQAWHRSYVGMLEEIEESVLSPRMESVLPGMSAQVQTLNAQASGTALADGVRDADYVIAVARSLFTGTTFAGNLGVQSEVLATLAAISNLQPATISLFGADRYVDFSQFQVRGHYATSERLGRYFRGMMWCGLIDFRFTGSSSDNSLRELSGAVAMHLLLKNSGHFTSWKQVDDIIRTFVGAPDALDFAQLNDLLTAAGVQSPANLPTQASLQALQNSLMSGAIGVQNIQSGFFWSPLTAARIKLPRSFAVMPTRFTMDAWTMNQCVFDRIFWDENGIPEFEDKVMRRVPSALEVAFAVFANDHATPWIVDRIANTQGHPWRDGLPYQHNLAAVREVLDGQTAAGWTNNLYQHWLACLRELSDPTTGLEYPDALRTAAWAMKTLNTQMASWTQLRHDTVLYAKQPYTGNVLCSYPAGFIEPRVVFWERMRLMALHSRQLLSSLPNVPTAFVFEPNTLGDSPITNTFRAMYTNRMQWVDNFAATMTTLADISTKQLARAPLNSSEVLFIESVIETPSGYSGQARYSGWYPRLFYENTRAKASGMFSVVDSWDALVTDVHTDPTDPIVGDPGSILHEGVGNPGLLVISINWGPGDACVYAGPVFSHYEFETGPTTRKTDEEWKFDLKAGKFPAQPEWTRGFVVPGNIGYPYP